MQHYCKETISRKSLTQTESLQLKYEWKNPAPLAVCEQCWFVELEKGGNITKNVIDFVANGDGQNCHRLWWAFNWQ